MTTPIMKRNGKGRNTRSTLMEETLAQSAADTLSIIDARFTRVEESLTRLHSEALDFRRAVLESHDEVLAALRRMEGRDA